MVLGYVEVHQLVVVVNPEVVTVDEYCVKICVVVVNVVEVEDVVLTTVVVREVEAEAVVHDRGVTLIVAAKSCTGFCPLGTVMS